MLMFKYMSYSKRLTLVLLIAFFSMAIFYPISASAQTSIPQQKLLNTQSVFNPSGIDIIPYSYTGSKLFGGRIISMQPCLTPAGIMLNIGGPRGGQFLLTDSSQIFNYGVFNPGIWTLGNASPSTVACKGKSGLFSGGFAIKTAVSFGVSFGVSFALNALLPGSGALFAIGDNVIKVGNIIGGISGFASRFGFGEKLDTLGHPHIIQMVGTSLTP